jgi:glycosyltransferase involved in cell wall biosynthesis
MAKTKILHITQALGGVETYIKEIIGNINYANFEVNVISPESKTLSAFCLAHNIRHTVVPMERGFNVIKDIKLIFTLKKLIKQYAPDIVHLHSAKAGFIGRISASLSKVKSVFTPNGASYLSFTGLKRAVFFLLEVFAKRYTYKILAVSDSEAIRLVYEVGHKLEKVDVIYNSISNIPDQKPVKPNSQIFKIGTIARLTYQKNPLLLVEIANEIINVHKSPDKEVHFYILGAGFHDHLRAKVEELIGKYSLSTRFHILDWNSDGGVESYLEGLDIFILPSLFEGLPFSLLEAMALEKVCVVSKCDGCNDVIQNGMNGYACLSLNDYKRVITAILNDTEDTKAIRTNAREYVLNYHNSKINVAKLELFYQSLIEAKI